ncbi:NAD-binding protein [Myxococcota bacterium]|nr:NAD-binding protein [Myxococcota bacterium]MBU1429214.1 NAD-binding protein [Myxococcota bacterium]MBU1900336.1 NAD-binding protein [Myxococcota bacterium]
MLQLLIKLLSSTRWLGRTPLGRVALALTTLLILSSQGFYWAEAGARPEISYGDALWWSIVTMTTVGYGDFFPQTLIGRWLIGLPTMLVGVGVLGYLISILASALIERRDRKSRGVMPYSGSGHVLICQMPDIDRLLRVVDEIRGDEAWRACEVVLVTDAIAALPEELSRAGLRFIHGNPSREAILRLANAATARRALIFSARMEANHADNQSLGVLVTLKHLNPDLFVVVEAATEENEALLRTAGASEVVAAGRISGRLMVQTMQDPGINDVIADLLSNVDGKQIYIESLMGYEGDWADLQRRLGGDDRLLLGVFQGAQRHLLPSPTLKIHAGDRLIYIAARRALPPGALGSHAR